MKTFKTIREEIEKGCDKYDKEHPELTRSCGDILFNNTIWYCPICQAKLSQLKECEEMIIEIINKLQELGSDGLKKIYFIDSEKLKQKIRGDEK